MELKHLHTVATIRDRKSFTAAARALGITQAAVSQHVAALEDELGVELFDRRNRQIKFTAAGRKLCEHADAILHQVAAAKEDVQGHPRSVTGVLQIASSTVPAATLLPQILADFQRQFPSVRTELKVTESETAAASVAKSEADVGFTGVKPKSSDLKSFRVADDELALIVGPDHPLADRKSISLTQLAETPLIVREENSGSRQCLEAALRKMGSSLADMHVVMEANSNDAIIAAVCRGSGAAFVSTALIDGRVRDGQVNTLKVRSLRPRRSLYLIAHSQPDGREPLASFVNFVRDAAT